MADRLPSEDHACEGPTPGDHRPVVVIPTYNNPATLGEVVRRSLALGLPVVVVDDGSTPVVAITGDAGPMAEGTRPTPSLHPTTAHVLRHPRNLGKAHALRTGFDWAQKRGHTHAVTIDADLQHDPEDIPALLEASRHSPTALVLGVRPADLANMPGRSGLGRRLSNLAIRVACGTTIRDSQSGLRVYPLELVAQARCRSGHFSFETEIIVRSRWAGAGVIERPIASRYLRSDRRVSHFRPCVDTARCLALHTRLLTTAAARALTDRSPSHARPASATRPGVGRSAPQPTPGRGSQT